MTTISPLARIYGDNVKIGKGCRIDDFCILTGNVKIGDYVHIGCYTFLSGMYGQITFEDFATTSSRVCIYTGSDDHAGGFSLVGPQIPMEFKPTLQRGDVTVGRNAHVLVGSVVLPGVTIGEGVVVGALSLVKRDLDPWGIYAGVPAKRLRDRPIERVLELEQEFLRKCS